MDIVIFDILVLGNPARKGKTNMRISLIPT